MLSYFLPWPPPSPPGCGVYQGREKVSCYPRVTAVTLHPQSTVVQSQATSQKKRDSPPLPHCQLRHTWSRDVVTVTRRRGWSSGAQPAARGGKLRRRHFLWPTVREESCWLAQQDDDIRIQSPSDRWKSPPPAPSFPPATATTGAALNYMFCVSGGLGGPWSRPGCRGAAALLFITRITLRPAHQLPRPRHHTRRYEVINLDKCAQPAPT